MELSPDQFWTAADRLGVISLLLIFVFGLFREWWVMGSTYRKECFEKQQLKEINDKSNQALEKAVHTLHQVVSALKKQGNDD